ncbi:hypothetical protein HOC80_02570 [archaeon]|jgi:hypothetical protein|nr:hypothetical protein [archaeon]MBT4416964.1 hypothetical protein [archaeon]
MKKSDWWLLAPIVILFAYLVIRLIDQSQVMFTFPFDMVNDWSSYMTQLHFLQSCGFHEFCPYWYGGFISFLLIAPAWFLVMYPLYLLIGNVQVVAYLSLVGTYVAFLVLFLVFGKKLKMSCLRSLLWFVFFTANAMAIGNFLRLGRLHEFFGLFWLSFLLLLFIYYKDRELDKYFLLGLPVYTLTILSHQVIAMLGTVMLLWFFVIRREKVYIALIFVLSLVIGSFWLYPYVMNFFGSHGVTIVLTETLLLFNSEYLLQTLITTITSLAVLTCFIFYVKGKNVKKEFLFFLPVLGLAFLVLTRLIIFVPGLKYVYPDTYNYFFIFFTLFFFLKTRFTKLKRVIPVLLILIAVASVVVSALHTPFFIENSTFDETMIETMEHVEGTFLILGMEQGSYEMAYYSYAALYLNLSTSSGWYSIPSLEYLDLLEVQTMETLEAQDCEGFTEVITELETTDIITFDEHCETLKMCGFEEKFKSEEVCLYQNVN